MTPATYEDAEKNFPKWLSKLLPSVDCEDWSIFTWEKGRSLLCDKYPEQQELIKRWEKEGIYPPDYKIAWKKHHQYLCWVDVKWTQRINATFNLNRRKRNSYLRVSHDTKLPAYIVIFTGKPCNNSPSKWGYIDLRRDSRILLKDAKSLILEIRRFISLAPTPPDRKSSPSPSPRARSSRYSSFSRSR